jgi:hypothetical protein
MEIGASHYNNAAARRSVTCKLDPNFVKSRCGFAVTHSAWLASVRIPGPHDDCAIKHAAALEILDERRLVPQA